jgi:hypothetical protein
MLRSGWLDCGTGPAAVRPGSTVPKGRRGWHDGGPAPSVQKPTVGICSVVDWGRLGSPLSRGMGRNETGSDPEGQRCAQYATSGFHRLGAATPWWSRRLIVTTA